MKKDQDQYAALGVDAGKESVRTAFGGKIENHFPGAFVNIIRDPEVLGQVLTQHNDGDGSKILTRLLMMSEGCLPSVLQGAVDDGLTMNMGDIGAAGFLSGLIMVTDVININGENIPKDVVMNEIAQRFHDLIELYRSWGFRIYFMGGETADLPFQVKTAVFDVAVSARAREKDIIKGNIKPGDCIWGVASDGRATWERFWNSGLMSNGLTLAWSVLMSKSYNKKYPNLILEGDSYRGRFLVGDTDSLLQGMTVDEALTSPTRQWAIFIKILVEKLKKQGILDLLHGITLNSGGGATKVKHIGTGGIIFNKSMPTPPPIFRLIQRESGQPWRYMFKSFNCGIGLDLIGEDDSRLVKALKEVEEETGIKIFQLGSCVSSGSDANEVHLATPFGAFSDY